MVRAAEVRLPEVRRDLRLLGISSATGTEPIVLELKPRDDKDASRIMNVLTGKVVARLPQVGGVDSGGPTG